MSSGYYVDTHCHLDSHHYEKDAVDVARRSIASRVRMLTMSVDVASSYRSVLLAEECPGVRAAVGTHPTMAASLDEVGWSEIEYLAASPRVVAIGETGLDYHWEDCPHDVQKEWFLKHIELSLTTGKPLSVHARESVADVLAMLEPRFQDGVKVIWHCFVAGKKDIGGALDFAAKHGMFMAVGGLVTFEDQKPLREQVKRIPEELLLLETDAPYLTPRPKKVERNEPAGVIRVAEVLGELRGVGAEDIRAATTRNADEVLGSWT